MFVQRSEPLLLRDGESAQQVITVVPQVNQVVNRVHVGHLELPLDPPMTLVRGRAYQFTLRLTHSSMQIEKI